MAQQIWLQNRHRNFLVKFNGLQKIKISKTKSQITKFSTQDFLSSLNNDKMG